MVTDRTACIWLRNPSVAVCALVLCVRMRGVSVSSSLFDRFFWMLSGGTAEEGKLTAAVDVLAACAGRYEPVLGRPRYLLVVGLIGSVNLRAMCQLGTIMATPNITHFSTRSVRLVS